MINYSFGMIWYPAFLDLRGRRILVAGAGGVALRKTRALVEAGARVTVVAPSVLPEFDSLGVRIARRKARLSDVRGKFLVFAATNNRETNRRLAEAAARQGVPVNVADAPAECTFLVPARARSGHIQVAISTGGRDPARAARIRRRLEKTLKNLAR